MPKKELIIIALLLLYGSVQAQRDFRRGYIITSQQDTVYGWIDYRGDIRNAKICSFKKTENEQATDYSPSDIAAYRFADSKYYVSRNIGSDDAPHQVFLEYLVNGMAKLYYFRDDGSNDRYFIENNGHFIELKADEKEVEIDGIAQKTTVKTYVGVLKATFNVWEMNNEIDKVKLEHSSLINIAKDYHHYVCTDGSECIVYEKKKPLMAVRIGPALGADLSMLKARVNDGEKYTFDPSTNLTVGVNLNFWMPRLNEKIFLQMQVMYTKYYFFLAYENPPTYTDIHIRGNALQIGLAVKYEYPKKGKWRPTLAAGAAVNYVPDGTIEEFTDIFTYSGIRPFDVNKDFPTKLMYGFCVIPGIHYYLARERVVFAQVQYLHCFNRENAYAPNNIIRSFGLSAGIYF